MRVGPPFSFWSASMLIDKKNPDYDYRDVFLIPQYSEITSRTQVSTTSTITSMLSLEVPVISANMDTVTESAMCIAMDKAGAIGALHRFMSIERNVEEFQKVKDAGAKCFVSIGVNADSKDRAKALMEVGAEYFVIDIAHGHSKMMKDMVVWLRQEAGTKVVIMAGNVATREATDDLCEWGTDIAKVGIGPGAVCLTKNVTGVTRPQFSAVLECSKGILPTVADGGIREIGDICKAIGVGASMVMCGKLFAGTQEAPGARIEGSKVYRGMASKDAMLTIREDDGNLPTPEGMTTTIKQEGSVIEVVKHIQGGLRSAMSYSNARTIEEFKTKSNFGIRFTA